MDTLIIIVMLVGALVGYIQGAFKMLANVVGLAVGIYVAAILYNCYADDVAAQTGAPVEFAQTVVFLLIAIIVPVVLGWVASLLTRFLKTIHLNCLNRMAGAVVGIVGYGLLLSFVLNLLDFRKSNAGLNPELLGQRSEMYYNVKHAIQPALPDVLIVTDSTEVANGATPRDGICSQLPF